MRIFIQAFDDMVWDVIESGWKRATTTNGHKKARFKWTHKEKKEATSNATMLNSIFVGVDQEQFKLISQCDKLKNA